MDDDAIDEPNGRITITLVEDASYKIDPANPEYKTLSGPMQDDDKTLVTVTASGGDISEAGGSKTFTITLSRALVDGEVLPINLEFTTGNRYATLGADFTLSPPTSPPSGVSYTNFDSTDASVNRPAIVFTGGKNAAKLATFTLTAKQDTVVEQPGVAPERRPYERVQVKILNFHGNEGFGRNDGATGGSPEPNVEFRILDDDQVTASPGLVLSHNNDLRIDEGKSKTLKVKLATNPGASVSVALSLESRTQGDDVSTALTVSPTSLQFTTSNWSSEQTVTITGLSDPDASSESAFLHFTPTGYSGVSAVNLTVSVDDLGAGLTLTSPSPSNITVNNTGTYTVKLKSKPSDDVTVTPVSSNERIATVSGDLTFTSANWNQAQTVTVTGKGAGDVQIAHTLDSNDNDYHKTMATSPVVFSVADTGNRTLTLEALTTTVEEGKSITVTAKLDRAHTVDTAGTLNFTLGGAKTGGGQGPPTTAESADFTPNTKTTVTIPAGSTSASVTLSAVNEAEGSAVYEGAETFGVTLFGGTRGVSTDINNNSAIITITDEADQPVFELVPPDPLNGAEGDQNKGRVFKVTKTGATELAATVEIASADGTATSPGDYTPIPANTALNFAKGDTEKSVTVTFKDDTVDELKEDFTVTISNPTAARLGAATSATVELTDDDPTVVQLTVGALAIDEAAGMKDIMVTLARALTTGESLPVKLVFAGDATFGEDYTLSAPQATPTGVAFSNLASTDLGTSPPTITFTGGDSASNTASITLTATQDKADEGDEESVTVSLGALGASSGTGLDGGAKADSTKNTGSFKITDDDGTPTSITLSVDTDSATDGVQDKISEGVASSPSVEVTATIDGGSVFTDDKTLRVSVVGDTATIDDDFEAVTAFDLEIPAGDNSVKGSFTLTPVYDGVKESDETISVTGALTPAVQGLTVNPATITLADDSVVPEISVSVDNSGKNITEGGDAVWKLTSSVSIPVDLTVKVTLTQEGSFVSAQTLTDTTTVTIPKNTTTATLTIASEADSTDEADGSLSLTVAAADNGEYTVSTTKDDAEVAVTDDDATGIALVAGASTTLTEGDASTSATLTLRLGRALVAGEIVEAPLAITSSTGAVIDELTDANRDYLLEVSGTGVTRTLARRPNPKIKFTGAAGVQEATITLTATARDDGDEDHETLSITLGDIQANNLATSISGGVVAHASDNDPKTPENTVEITIQDDEGLKPQLSIDWASGATEPTEGGKVKMSIKASPAPEADLTIHLTVSEEAGTNFVAASEEGAKTMVLKKGATEVAFDVPTVNDTRDEIDGKVTVTIVANDAYRVGSQSGRSMPVRDDEATPITIERDCGFKTCYPISENGATAEFDVSLGLALGASDQTVTVPLNVTGATAGTHYTLALKSGAQTGVTLLTNSPHSAQNPALRFSGKGAKDAALTLTTVDNNDNTARTLNLGLGTLTSNKVSGGVEKGAASTASVKIVNDDGTPVVRVEAQVAELREGQNAGGIRDPHPKMYIYAEPVPQTDITVSATLSQKGNVIDRSGAQPGRHSYTIKAGQAAPQVVQFRIANDLDDEPTSFVTLEVHAGQGYTLSSTQSSATTRVIDTDDGPTVSLSAASASVTEGSNAAFTVSRGTEGTNPYWDDDGISVVRLRISQRGDFVADEELGVQTITLNKGESSKTYNVPTIGDFKGEKDGTVTAELLPALSDETGYAVDFPPNNEAEVTVEDDDGGAPGVTIYNENTTVSEKNLSQTGSYTVELATDPGQTATLTVNVPAAHQDSLTVQAPGGTAGSSATLDFTSGAGGTWDIPQMITVAPLIDDDGEPDTFALTHSIANYPGHTGPIDDVSVTVRDLGYDLRLSHNNRNNKLEVAEPAGQESYGIRLTSQPANNTSVIVTPTSGDTTLATVGGVVTFTSSDWKDPKPITVSGLKQGPLTITHAVTSTDPNYKLSGNFPVGVTVIADNRRTVELSAAPNPVAEGADVTLTATIPQAVYPQKAVTIPFSYTEGTAVTADYTETASITIDAGQTTGTTTLATVDDTAHETPDETFTVAFGTLPRELLAGTTTSVDISIDDAADVARKVNLSVAKNPVREGADSVELTVTLDAAFTAPARAVTIPLSYTLDTAEAEDFTEVADVTIASGETSATVTIPIVDDATHETPGETFTIGLGTLPAGLAAGDTAEVEVEIDDISDAPAVVTFEASEVQAPDSGHVVTVQLDKSLPQDLTIPLVYTFGTANASDINQIANITIAAGHSGPVTGGTITFNLVNNSIFDGGGTFTIGLGALPLPATQLVTGDIDEMEITILDEADSPGFAYAQPETGGVTPLVEGDPELALIRTGNTKASSFIAYRTSTSTGAAKPGSDYTLTPAGKSALIEVPAGDSTPSLKVPIIDDDEDEFASEFFYFEVQRNGHVGARSVPKGSRLIRIVDDDPTPVTLSPSSDVSIDEGDDNTTAKLTLELARRLYVVRYSDGSSLREVAEIPLAITTSTGAALPGSADPDFTIAVSGNAVTATGLNSAAPKIKFEETSANVQTAGIATITITATTRDDGDFQDEAIQIALGDLTASTLATNLEGGVSATDDGDPATDDNIVAIKIVDDEEGPDGFDLSVDTNSVAENAQAAATINVTATAKDNGSFTQDHDIEITVGDAAEDTAISGTDYAAVEKFTFTVTAGQSSASGSFSLDPTDDTLDEADETLSVTGTSGSLEITPASITITDDDPEPTVSVAHATAVAEGEDPAVTVDMSFTVSLSVVSGKEVTVPYTLTGTATDGADYDAPATQSLTIAAGDTSGEIVIPVKGDAIDEVDETIIVTLGAPTNATISSVAGAGAATGSITDDDVPEFSITAGAAVTEGTAASFTVDADIAPVADLTVKVDVDTTAGFAASNTTGAQTFTFRAGEMSETYEVNTESDSDDEADGSVSVTLKDGADYAVASSGDSASVDVNDDDATSVTLGRAGSGGIAEADGSVDVTVTLGRKLVAGESVTVPLTVSGAVVTTHYTLGLKGGGGTGVSLDTAAPHSAQHPAVTLAGAEAQTATLTLTTVDNTDRVARTVTIAYGTDDGTNDRSPSSSGLSGGVSTTGSASVPILDDDAQISVADASAAEGSAVMFNLTLPDPAPSGGVTIDYSTSDGRGNNADAIHQVATSADDYTAAAATASITIAQGDSSGTISIATTDDDTYEGDHYFTLTLDSTDTFNISDTAGSATGTITDAADTPTFDFSAASTDAEEDDGTVTLTVSKTGTTLVAATVSYATVDGTATGGSDFTAIASTNLSFAVADTSKDITVSLTDDSTDEPAEAFTVGLTAGADAQLGSTASHTVNIADNDATTVTLEAPSTAIDEDAGTKTITVTLGRALEGDETLSVPLAFSGAATFGSDYTLASPNSTPTGVSYSNLTSTDLLANPPTIAFSGVDSAASSATVILTATADTTDEGASEAVTVGLGTLNANSGTNLGGGASGSGTATFNIEDDDGTPAVTLKLSSASITEDGGSSTVTATLSGASSQDVTLTVAAAAVSPTVPGDFALSENTTLTIAAGATESTGAVTVTAVDNEIDAANKTVTVSATATGGNGIASPANATLTITDDDERGISVTPVTLTLDEADNPSTQNTSEHQKTYTVELDTQPTGTVTVNLSSGDIKIATLSESSLEFTASDWDAQTVTVTVTVTAVADDIDNAGDARTVRITHTVSAAGTDYKDETAAPVDVTVTDDDGEPTLSIDSPSVAEGDSSTATMTFKVTLTPASGKPVSVAYADAATGTATSATDYAAVTSGTLNFTAGETEKTVTVTVNGDTTDEPNETVILRLSSPSNAALSGGETALDGTGTITDDDATPTATLVLTPATIDESGNKNESTVTATLSGASSEAVTLTVAATAVDPAVAGDFTLSENKTLTIAAGSKASTGAVTITAVDNTVDAANKTVTVSATATGGGVADPANATLTITDDDTRGVTVAGGPLSMDEADKAGTQDTREDQDSYTVVLDSEPTDDVRIDITALNIVTLSPTSLTFTPSNWNQAQTVTATAVDDAIDNAGDARAGSITHAVVAGDSDYAGVAAASVEVTVNDDDGTPVVTLELDPASIDESGDDNATTVTASLSGASSQDVTLTVAAAAVSPAAADDFALSENTTLTIAAGSTTSTGTVTITAVNNDIDAANKTVTVSATATGGNGIADPANAPLTITDDDERGISVSPVTLTLTEADDPSTQSISEHQKTYTVELDSEPTGTVTVTLASGDTTTATLSDNSLEFTASDWDAQTVTVTAVPDAIDNAGDQRTASITHTVSATGTDYDGETAAPVSVTVTDDDGAPTLSIDSPSVTEGDGGTATMTFTVTLAPASGKAVSVDYDDAATGMADSGDDYAAITNGSLNFAAGDKKKTVAVTVNGDTTDEPNETVVLRLSSPSNATLTGGAQTLDGTGTITDDDDAPTGITLTVDKSTIAEDAATATVTVTATVTGGTAYATNKTVSVKVGKSGDTAVEGADYANVADIELTINAMETSAEKTFSLDPTDDDLDEDTKTISVAGTSGDIMVTGVNITITDDDDAPTVSVADATAVNEGNDPNTTVNLSFTVTLDAVSGKQVTVPYTLGGTATATDDYTAPSPLSVTIAAGSRSANIDIPVKGDTLDEPNETVTVTLGAPTNATVSATEGAGEASGAITDDDATPTATLTLTPAAIDESGATNQSTVTASLNGATSQDLTLTVAAAPVSPAVSGDFTLSANKTLTIAAGATASTGAVTVTAVDNSVDAPNKTVTFSAAASGGNGVAGPTGVTLTINDDEGTPTVSVADATAVTEGDDPMTTQDMSFALTLSGTSSQAITVPYTLTGTATGGSDYETPNPLSATIAAGQRSGTIVVKVKGDTADEVDETIDLTLGTPTNATVSAVQGAGTASGTITDDDATTVLLARAGSGGIAEDGGTEELTITLGRALVAGESVTVPLAVSGATVATHYTLGLKGNGGKGVSLDTTSPHSAASPAVTLSGAGAQTATLTLTAVANTDNASRTVSIAYGTGTRAPSSSGLSGGITTSGSASVPVLDDDAMVSIAAASAAEGSAVVFTVTLPENAPSGGVSVGYSTSDGRGNNDDDAHQVATGADYTAAAENAALSIAAGSRTGAISIPTTQDSTYEGDHYFTLNLDSTSHFNVSETAGSATGTITDAADTPSFAFSAASTDADEDDGTLILTVAKTGTTLVAATVSYATANGTATGGSDFTAITSTDLDFTASEASKTINVSLTDDGTDEPSEAFTVSLTAGAHARLGSTSSISINITDNDATAVTLEAPSTAIDEDAGTKTITVELGRELTGDETLTVPLSFEGTATFGTDYTLAAPNSTPIGVSYSNLASTDLADNPPSIAFSGVENAASSATLNLKASDDSTHEGAAESVSVGLGTLNANSGTNLDGGASGSGTATFNITDDDDAPTGITLTVDTTTIAEDDDPATVTLTATVNGGTAYQSDTTVKVKVGVATDSAVEGADYANVADFDLLIKAGAMSVRKTFSLNPTDNALDEADKTISVTGTSDSLTITGASIALTDDDVPELSVTGPAVTEGSDAVFTIAADPAPHADLNVRFTISESGGFVAAADTGSGKSVTLAKGASSVTFDVETIGDTVDEASGSVTLTLAGGTGYVLGSNKSAGIGILDDDKTQVTLAAGDDTTLTEQEPTDTGGLTITLSRDLAPGEIAEVPLVLTTATGMVIAESDAARRDFTLSASGAGVSLADKNTAAPKVTITGGAATEQVATLTFAATSRDDGDLDLDRLRVGIGLLTTASLGTVLDGGIEAGAGLNRASIDIIDYRDPAVELSAASIALKERFKGATYDVRLASNPRATVTVKLSASEKGKLSLSPSTLTFTPDGDTAWNTAQKVTITAKTDEDADDETITVSHAVTAPKDTPYHQVSAASLQANITDFGHALDLSATSYSVREYGGTDEISVLLTSRPTADVTLTATTQDGEYIEILPGPWVFSAADWKPGRWVKVIVKGIKRYEHSKFVSVDIVASSADSNYDGKTLEVDVAITEDTRPVVTLTANPAPVAEGADLTLTASIDASQMGAVAVPFVYVNDTASAGDYTAVASITIPANQTSAEAKVAIADDSTYEGSEAFSIGIGNLADTYRAEAPVDITIDDEADAPSFSFALTASTAAEADGTHSLTVSKTGAASVPISLAWATADGTALAASDYTGVSAGSLDFPAADASASLDVTLTDDDADELAENFHVDLVAGAGAKLGANTRHTVTLTDSDPTTVSLSAPSGNIDEAAAAKRITLTLGRGLATGESLVVPLRITGTATLGSDYALAAPNPTPPGVAYTNLASTDLATNPPSVTFTGDDGASSTATLDLTATADVLDEGASERVRIRLGTLAATGLAGGAAASDDGDETTTDNELDFRIQDDDAAPTGVTLSLDTDSVKAGEQSAVDEDAAAVTVSVTAAVDGATTFGEATEVSVTVGDADDSAKSGDDYKVVDVFTLTIPAGATSVTGSFSFEPEDDALDEPDETVSVTGESGDLTVTGTSLQITDDDVAPGGIALSLDATSVAENVETGPSIAVTASVSGETRYPAAVTVRVTVGKSTDNAVSGTDYTAVDAFDIEIAAGAASATKSFTLDPTDDAFDEVDETITVSGESGDLTVNDASITLTDDDVPELSISAGAAVTEGTAASFTLEADRAPAADLTVNLDVATSTGFATSGTTGAQTFTFRAGKTSESYTVSTESDSADEADGSVSVSLKAGMGYAVAASDNSASVDVNDDDATSVTLSPTGPIDIAENGGSTDVTVTLGRALVAGETVTVPLTVSGATVTTHYTLGLKSNGGTGVSIDTTAPHSAQHPAVTLDGAGAQTATLTLTAVANGDRLTRIIAIGYGTNDGTNDRRPAASGLSGGISAAGASSVRILDDDAKISVAAASAAEGSAVVFMVTLPDPAPAGDVTIDYSTNDGRGETSDADYQVATSADYTAAAENATLTIDEGDSSGTISISTTADTTYEGDHHFTLTLDATDNFNISDTAGSAIGTITDADDTPSFAFAAASTTADEDDGALTLAVQKTGDTLLDATVSYATADGTATGGSDFTAIASTDLVFKAADRSKDISISLTDDSTDEPAEAFTVDLTAGADAKLGSTASHSITITDNDATTVTLGAPAGHISENAGTKTLT